MKYKYILVSFALTFWSMLNGDFAFASYDQEDVAALIEIRSAFSKASVCEDWVGEQYETWSGVEWDFENPRRLVSLNLNGRGLKSNRLDVSSLSSLKSLQCSKNKLLELDTSGLEHLVSLDCRENLLTELDLSHLRSLENLDCSFNKLTNLIIPYNTSNLKILDCQQNYLRQLNLTGLKDLLEIRCNNNSLSALDLKSCVNLTYLYCSLNELKSLDIHGLSELREIHCSSNLLREIDLSGLVNLRFLACVSNPLGKLKLSGISNFEAIISITKGNTIDLISSDVEWITEPSSVFSLSGVDPISIETLDYVPGILCTKNKDTFLSVYTIPKDPFWHSLLGQEIIWEDIEDNCGFTPNTAFKGRLKETISNAQIIGKDVGTDIPINFDKFLFFLTKLSKYQPIQFQGENGAKGRDIFTLVYGENTLYAMSSFPLQQLWGLGSNGTENTHKELNYWIYLLLFKSIKDPALQLIFQV